MLNLSVLFVSAYWKNCEIFKVVQFCNFVEKLFANKTGIAPPKTVIATAKFLTTQSFLSQLNAADYIIRFGFPQQNQCCNSAQFLHYSHYYSCSIILRCSWLSPTEEEYWYSLFNCSQTKFGAIILVLLVFFMQFFV